MSEKSKTIWQTTGLVFIIIVVTKLLGFVKQIIVAACYGATFETDIYNIAYGFVNSTGYALFSALSVTFLTMYNKKRKEDVSQTNQFITSTIILFSGLVLVLCGVLFFFSKPLAEIITNGYNGDELAQLSGYIRIFVFLLMLYCINTIFGAILEANKKFSVSRAFGLVTSLSIILSTVILYKRIGINALIIGSVLAYVIQTVLLIINVRKYYSWSKAKSIINQSTKELIKLIFPLLIGNGIYEINKLLDRYLASGLDIGVTTSLANSQIVLDSSSALFIVSICSVLFAYLATMVSEKREQEVKKQLLESTVILLMIIIPYSMFLFVFSGDIIEVLFRHGNYSLQAAEITAWILKGYCIGMPFLALREILMKVHYAYQDSKHPMINSTVAVIINMVVSIVLTKSIGAIGIAIGTSVSYTVCSLLLTVTVRKHCGKLEYGTLLKKIIMIGLASLLTVAVSMIFRSCISELSIYIVMPLELLVGVILYVIILKVFRVQELNVIWQILRRKK